MTTQGMDRLLNQARVRAPGALDDTIKLELFATLQEFFQDTNIWTERIDVPVLATSYTYHENPDALTYDVIPSAGQIVRLIAMLDSKGRPVTAGMPEVGSVVLGASPSEDQTYTAVVSLTVKDPAGRDGIPAYPDWIVEKYNLEILDGVLGRLLSQPAKPYSSPQLALTHLRKFASAKSQAKVETERQNVYGAQNWRFPSTFRRMRRL